MTFPVAVCQLSKRFGKQSAVHNLSFQVEKGQILGFLGPNGAGKSTTMRMLTGYLRPTQGRVWIGGYDISQYPRQASRYLGYLPENNPLYLEMYVYEYLRFMGRIHGLCRKQCIANAQALVDRCGITAMQNKKLRVLSKGYRQRIGLAQALMHDPEVLILDEPTTGLDPNQLREFRTLIKEVSSNKAVILSTHLMQEVEALCNQVLLINQGKMIIHDTIAQLTDQTHGQLVVEFKEPIVSKMLEEIYGVHRVRALSEHKYILDTFQDIREALFRFARANELTLLRLEQPKNSLEAIFQRLTAEL